MRQARHIDIPKDRPLTREEYEDFSSHALNSSMWYVTSYVRNSYQVRQKLLDKGYIEGEVRVQYKKDEIRSFNIIEDTIKNLQELAMLDDSLYVEQMIESYRRKGKGNSLIRIELARKLLPIDFIDEALEKFSNQEEILDSIEKQVDKVKRTSSYKNKENEFEKDQKITQYLLSRGFTFDDISLWKDSKNSED